MGYAVSFHRKYFTRFVIDRYVSISGYTVSSSNRLPANQTTSSCISGGRENCENERERQRIKQETKICVYGKTATSYANSNSFDILVIRESRHSHAYTRKHVHSNLATLSRLMFEADARRSKFLSLPDYSKLKTQRGSSV